MAVSLFVKPLSRHCPACMIIAAFLFIAQPLHARSVYTQVTAGFLSLDSLLDAITDTISSFRTATEVDDFLHTSLKPRPEIDYVIRTSAQARITNKVNGSQIFAASNRVIANQNWYKTIELSKRPYYSTLTEKEVLYLFWCKPVFTSSTSGQRFNGAIAVKINLSECFSTIARIHDLQFQITSDGTTVFNNLPETVKPASLVEQRLVIYGIRGLMLGYPDVKPAPAAVAAVSPTISPASPEPLEQAQKSQAPRPAVRPIHRAESSTLSTGKTVALVLTALLCFGILITCIMMMTHVAAKRQKFLEAVERGEV